MPIPLYDDFFRIVGALNKAGVPYAVCGGVAVSLYTEPRATKDIDVLLCSKDIEALCAALDTVGYRQWAPPWTFRSSNITLHRFLRFEGEDFLVVDVLAGNEPEYDRMVHDAIVTQTAQGPVRLVRREDLITLKRGRNSLQDQADIAALQNEPPRTNDPRSERPQGLLHPDGAGAPGRPARRNPARRGRHKKRPGKVHPRKKRLRPAK